MARLTGSNADTLNGFALAVELRACRERAGYVRIVEVASQLGVPRPLLDGVELGDYNDRDSRKHLTKWSRRELLELLAEYRVPALAACAYLRLALLGRALRESESDEPFGPDEWREVGGKGSVVETDLTSARVAYEVSVILRRHEPAWERLCSRRPATPALTEVSAPREIPAAVAELSAAESDIVDFLAHATTGQVPVRLMERAGVSGGEPAASVEALRRRGILLVSEDHGALLAELAAPIRTIVLESKAPTWRWREQPWARRSGLRYMFMAINDDARQRVVAPLGNLRSYLVWLRAAVESNETAEALVAWVKLSRYLWEVGERTLFAEAEDLGAQALDQLPAANARDLLRGLHLAAMAYLELDRGLLESVERIQGALTGFEQLGDFAGQAISQRYLGLALFLRRRPDDLAGARQHFRDALACLRRIERGALTKGDIALALEDVRRLGLFSALVVGYRLYAGDVGPSRAELHNLMASVEFKAGRLDQALKEATRSIALYRKASHRWPGSEVAPLITRARIHMQRRAPAPARADLRAAVRLARKSERRDLERGALLRWAELEIGQVRPREALKYAELAERLVADKHHRDGEYLNKLRQQIQRLTAN